MADGTVPSRRWSLADALGLGGAVLASVVALRPLDDNSFLTHLATGRLILSHGVPRTDPYTEVAAGHEWVVQSWIPSLLYALIERSVGAHGLLALNGVLVGTLAGLLWMLSRPAQTLLGRVVLVGPAIIVGSVLWSERPLLFGLISLALLALLLQRAWPPWLAVPLLWIWGQSHGSWPLGLVFVLLLLVGERWAGTVDRAHVRVAVMVAIGSVTIALSPDGFGRLVFPFEMLGRSDVLRYITEWRPASFLEPWPWVHVALVALGGGVAAWQRDRRSIPVLFFAGATSLLALRNIPVAAILIVFAAAPSLGELSLGAITGRQTRGLVASLAIASVGVLAASRALQNPAYRLDDYPIAVLAHLSATAPGSGFVPDGLMHDSQVGNLIEAMSLWDGLVFIDDRIEVLPAAFVHDYVAMSDVGPQWDRLLDDHGVRFVLWPMQAPLTRVLKVSPDWRIAAGDGQWALMQRR